MNSSGASAIVRYRARPLTSLERTRLLPPNSLFHRENTGNFRFGANQGSLRPIKDPTILRRFLENSLIDGTGNFTLPNRERKFVDQRICQGSSENTIDRGYRP